MFIKYSEIYIFYYEKTLAVNAVILGILMVLFIFTYVMRRSYVSKYIWWIIAVISCCSLLYITVISREIGSTSYEPLKYLFLSDYHSDEKIIEMTGNIIMFIPFGASVRMIIGTKHPFVIVCLLGIIASLMFESMQYFLKCGYIEIVDILTNEIGMIIGSLASSIVIRIMKK